MDKIIKEITPSKSEQARFKSVTEDFLKKLNSKLINGMKNKGIDINRKVLANIAVENPNAFADLVKFVSA